MVMLEVFIPAVRRVVCLVLIMDVLALLLEIPLLML